MILKLNPYAYLINFKNYLYDQKIINQIQIPQKIISVGNLNFGGSGKTPLIHFICQSICESQNSQKILIVCKSYKALLKTAAEVHIDSIQKPTVYGDEACLLKSLLPDCTVWSGPIKSQTVLKANQTSKFDWVLIDDGFSHRQISRTRDIVLVDVSRNIDHYQLFPCGQMRENWSSLQRSHLVVLTKTEGEDVHKINYFKNKIKTFQNKIITAEFKTILDSKNKNIFLVTGLGHPQKLQTELKNLGFVVKKFKFYSDHFHFSKKIQEELLNLCVLNPELQLVMTAKDFIKISSVELKSKIKIVQLQISMTEQDKNILYEILLS